MKCSNVRKEIDQRIYEGLEPDPGGEISRHLGSCITCSQYLENSRFAAGKIAAISQRVPILKNPEELTEDIMKAILENQKDNPLRISGKSKKSGLVVLQRLLAAASVCLFLAFGYEQYVVVDKISRLEKQNAAITQSSQYQAALKLKKAISIFSSDPEMLNRYKEIRKRKMSLITWFKAAMYVDLAGTSPEFSQSHFKADHNAASEPVIFILKQFDSTHNILQ